MTVIGQMFEEEKQEAIRKNTEEVAECTELPLEKVKELEASILAGHV